MPETMSYLISHICHLLSTTKVHWPQIQSWYFCAPCRNPGFRHGRKNKVLRLWNFAHSLIVTFVIYCMKFITLCHSQLPIMPCTYCLKNLSPSAGRKGNRWGGRSLQAARPSTGYSLTRKCFGSRQAHGFRKTPRLHADVLSRLAFCNDDTKDPLEPRHNTEVRTCGHLTCMRSHRI